MIHVSQGFAFSSDSIIIIDEQNESLCCSTNHELVIVHEKCAIIWIYRNLHTTIKTIYYLAYGFPEKYEVSSIILHTCIMIHSCCNVFSMSSRKTPLMGEPYTFGCHDSNGNGEWRGGRESKDGKKYPINITGSWTWCKWVQVPTRFLTLHCTQLTLILWIITKKQ